MYGPYRTRTYNNKQIIDYIGNQIFQPKSDVGNSYITEEDLHQRLHDIAEQPSFYHLHRIDDAIFHAAVSFFQNIEAKWCNLPLTTLMISSPGEVYAGRTLSYTTDALPVKICWFEHKRNIFLAESSQFYLELYLLIQKTSKVFCIYNSFRKEKADFSHLSEFQHIEFEGHVDFQENLRIGIELIQSITNFLIDRNRDDLSYFIGEKDIDSLSNAFSKEKLEVIVFRNALKLLYRDTQDPKYTEFSLKNFGAWEEIRLTEIVGKHVILTEYPLLEIPFYHNDAGVDSSEVQVAENADIILSGYREVLGSGVRIYDSHALMKKAHVFNLPEEDYAPYLESRSFPSYKKTAGFGLGWQRYVQWILKLPYIWNATLIPRTHHLPYP